MVTSFYCWLNYAEIVHADYLPLQQSYICTLSLGCMKDVKSSEVQSSSIHQVSSISTLHTASEFCLDHDVLQFIDICIAEKKQKQTGDSCSAQSESTEVMGDMQWVSSHNEGKNSY